MDFLRQSADGGPPPKVARVDPNAEDHICSYDKVCNLDHALMVWTGKGLDQIKMEGPLADDEVPRSLLICMDWLQVQWRMFWWLRHKAKANIEAIMDTVHRRQRDFTLAMEQSHFDVTVQKGHIVANVGFWPVPEGQLAQGRLRDGRGPQRELEDRRPLADYVLAAYCLRLRVAARGGQRTWSS